MNKLIDAQWVMEYPITGEEHIDLIRELMAYHCICRKSNSLAVSLDTGKVFERHENSAIHWSRVFEWPWAILNGELKPNQKVLDAGGSHAVFQYAAAKRILPEGVLNNVDLGDEFKSDVKSTSTRLGINNINTTKGNILTDLGFYNYYDRVFCISVVEHIPEWRRAIDELMAVLKPGGIMILTMDIERVVIVPGKEFHIGLNDLAEFLSTLEGGRMPGCDRPLLQIMPNGSVLSCVCLKIQKGQ